MNISNKSLVLCRDPCTSGPEDCWIEDGRTDPQAGTPCIVVRVRASVPPKIRRPQDRKDARTRQTMDGPLRMVKDFRGFFVPPPSVEVRFKLLRILGPAFPGQTFKNYCVNYTRDM